MMKSRFLLVLIPVFMSIVSCSEDSGKNEPQPVTPPTSPETPEYTIGTRINVTVLDYSPAPGQFINEIPEYEAGDTKEIMEAKATTMLNNGDMISLGAWGGNITIKLNTPIKNIADKPDFRVMGNAIYSNSSIDGTRYGSAEPGIILVMKDENNNGLADDTWHEISGDQSANAIGDYTVTYHRPTASATDTEYIAWNAANGDTGFINRNISYHTQDFFPMWLGNIETMTFSGRRLPDNGYLNSSTGKFDLISYDGYADSHPNTTDASCIDIAKAIDANGNPVNLSSIDFIKIYTGVLQANGPLGECSTEIAGIESVNQE